jgi:hypothetical protein
MGPSTAGRVMACWAFGLGLYNHKRHEIGVAWLLLAAALDAEEARYKPGEEGGGGAGAPRRIQVANREGNGRLTGARCSKTTWERGLLETSAPTLAWR